MNPDERIRMINCNAHKKDTHRVQNSDAGVGFGTLIGDRDYFTQKNRKLVRLPHLRFMFFDRN